MSSDTIESYAGFNTGDYVANLGITNYEAPNYDCIFSEDGELTLEQARNLGLDLSDNLI